MKLNKNWVFTYQDKTYPATVPGTIHTDLINNDLLVDPYMKDNEPKIQWVDKEDWTYLTEFHLKDEELTKEVITLTFDSLDTYTDITLNGHLILKTSNMFIPYTVNVKDYVQNQNTLSIKFRSPIKEDLPKVETTGFEYMAINDDSNIGGLNENKVSIYARKAPYHYGWDWGPRIVTSGINGDITLSCYNEVTLQDIQYDNHFVNNDIYLDLSLTLDAYTDTTKTVTFNVSNGQSFNETLKLSKGKNKVSYSYLLNNIEKWYPNGYGNQTLYTIDTYIDQTLIKSFKKGFSEILVITEKDEFGESFYFQVNGLKVYSKGANHIPNSMYLPDVTKEHYYHELLSAKEANYNTIRVWGGGVYESDTFYQLCDELGLLVWQDFMFACSMYPGDKDFLQSVEEEAVYQVNRLKKHASIALFCGNNENDNAWGVFEEEAGWGWKQKYTQEQQDLLTKYYLDVFHDILPNSVESNSNIFYWASSPWTGHLGKHSTYSSTSGDMHYWDVWHGRKPFKDFKKVYPRFMSEFGIQSFPSMKTIEAFTDEEDRDIYSPVMTLHQKSPIGNEVIMHYIDSLYKKPTGMKNEVYFSQLIQAEGIKYGVEHMRRNIHNTMGILYWQINDCYPVASWSSIDYYGRLKALHYYAKHFYNGLLVSQTEEGNYLEIHVTNDTYTEYTNLTLETKVMSFDGEVLKSYSKTIDINEMSDHLVDRLPLNEFNTDDIKENYYVHSIVMKDEAVLSSNNYFLNAFKDLQLKPAVITTKVSENEIEYHITVSSNTFVKSLEVDFKEIDLILSDNYFDLNANEEKVITISKTRNIETSKEEIEKQLVLNHVQLAY